MSTKKRLPIRMSEESYDFISDKANEFGMSLNSYILFLIAKEKQEDDNNQVILKRWMSEKEIDDKSKA